MVTIALPDEAATAALGARVAGILLPGDLILLDGDLGAGKTALARAIIRTLMADSHLDVPSPTFALIQPYEGQGFFVLHADLYRLTSEREVDELGLFDRDDAIILVEWPERAPGLGARATGRVALRSAGAGRDADVTFADGRDVPA
jgi:tRNA threonylcarbamoyl adenosine modification protein YjeE